MHVESGLSEVTGLPIVKWTQRRAITTLPRKIQWKLPVIHDPYYGEKFHHIKIVEEEVMLIMGPDGDGRMVLARPLTAEDARGKDAEEGELLGFPMQDVRGFVLEAPAPRERVHRWKSAFGYNRAVPVPSTIKVDVGGGELIYIGQHLDADGTEMPHLRKLLQAMFVEHDLVRQWQAKFRGGRAAGVPVAPAAPPVAAAAPPPNPNWSFGPFFNYGTSFPRPADDDVI